MPSLSMRRPLPALIALLALLLLTALVWWRVLHRGGDGDAEAACPTATEPVATLPAPSRITLIVLNATKRNGIAARARTTLVTDGFNVPRLAANDKPRTRIPGVAEIRFGPRAKEAAKLVHYYLPGARMVTTQSKGNSVVVSLGQKYRTIASPSAVSAELRRKHIVLETAAPGSPSASPSASC